MSLYDGKPRSPNAVSVNGAVYAQVAGVGNYDIDVDTVLVILEPTA